MSNVMKKITIGNPLINFEMMKEYDEYQKIDTDEQLADFYHKLLDNCPKEKETLQEFIYAMISFSTGAEINPLILL